MAQRRTNVHTLVEAFAPDLADEFLRAIEGVRDAAQVERIAEALRAGEIERAIAYTTIEPAIFDEFSETVRRAYQAAGRETADAMPLVDDGTGVRAKIRFDGRNIRAENWLREYSATRITGDLIPDQIEGLREVMSASMRRGENPRTTALYITGRTNRATGKREGGLLGLTKQQMGFVENARQQLASGDPTQLRAYLTRDRRDRRYDRQVLAAIREGRPLAAADISLMSQRYSDRLLAYRGEVVGRTEAMASLHAGQREALNQMEEKTGVRSSAITKIWRSAQDGRERPSHRAMHGEEVQKDQPFSNGLMHPGDPSGAAEEVIQCRCWVEYRVDFLDRVT